MKLIFGLLFLIISNISLSHEYYFSFAEMEYNDISRKFEVTITASTHDLEMIYEKNAQIKLDLQTYNPTSQTSELIKEYFDKHFQLSTKNERCKLNLIGYESSLNGTTNFYFESDEIDITPTLLLQNDVLMDQFPKQQNKITLYYQSKSYTYDFLFHERTKTIILD